MKRVMLTMILATGIAAAQGTPPEGVTPRLEALQTALDVTGQQVQDLVAFAREQREAARESNLSIMEQLRTNQETLKEMIDSGAADLAAVGQIVIQNAVLKEQLKGSRDAVNEAIRDYVSNTLNRVTELAELEAAAEQLPAIHQAQRLGILDGPAGGGPRGHGGPRAGAGPIGPGAGPGGPGGPAAQN